MARERCQPGRRPKLRYFCILGRVQRRAGPRFSMKNVLGNKTHKQLVCVSCTAFFAALPTLASAQITTESAPKNLTLLQGDTLNKAFNDRTMDGTYKGVRERTDTSNFTETFFKNGATDYREGKLRERGRWQLSGPPGFEDVICFMYQGTMAGPPSCFTVFRDGTCLYSYSPRMVKNGKPLNNNYWQAKTVIRGELSSCDDLVG